MPETRCVKVYEDGVYVGEEDCYEVSDEELHQEQLAQECNDKSHVGQQALNNWDALSLAQKDTVLKNVLWYLLYKEGLL